MRQTILFISPANAAGRALSRRHPLRRVPNAIRTVRCHKAPVEPFQYCWESSTVANSKGNGVRPSRTRPLGWSVNSNLVWPWFRSIPPRD